MGPGFTDDYKYECSSLSNIKPFFSFKMMSIHTIIAILLGLFTVVSQAHLDSCEGCKATLGVLGAHSATDASIEVN